VAGRAYHEMHIPLKSMDRVLARILFCPENG
jgi:hypothetical protein